MFLKEFGEKMESECRSMLSAILPFTDKERAFLDLLLDHGCIDPALLTADPILQRRINNQPLLKWKAQNIRKYKGLPEDP